MNKKSIATVLGLMLSLGLTTAGAQQQTGQVANDKKVGQGQQGQGQQGQGQQGGGQQGGRRGLRASSGRARAATWRSSVPEEGGNNNFVNVEVCKHTELS